MSNVTAAQAASAEYLFQYTADVAVQTVGGPSGHYDGAAKGLITKAYKATLAKWGGDYDALRAYIFPMMMQAVKSAEGGEKARLNRSFNYLAGRHFDR